MMNNETPLRFGIKETIIEQITGVLSSHPEVESAILYGSRVKGNYRKGSDIDLTLTGRCLNYQIVARIEDEIDELLLPYLFDISILSYIDNPDVVAQIHRVGILLYERSPKHSETDI